MAKIVITLTREDLIFDRDYKNKYSFEDFDISKQLVVAADLVVFEDTSETHILKSRKIVKVN